MEPASGIVVKGLGSTSAYTGGAGGAGAETREEGRFKIPLARFKEAA